MSCMASERMDVVLNLTKLIDVEVRDERGVTKLIIPVDVNHINLTEYGNAYINLLAFPSRHNDFGATHAVIQHLPKHMRTGKNVKAVLGSVFPHGRFDYYDGVAAHQASQRAIKKKEKDREQKYKGLDF